MLDELGRLQVAESFAAPTVTTVSCWPGRNVTAPITRAGVEGIGRSGYRIARTLTDQVGASA